MEISPSFRELMFKTRKDRLGLVLDHSRQNIKSVLDEYLDEEEMEMLMVGRASCEEMKGYESVGLEIKQSLKRKMI
jgi:hypothetical protein